MSANATEEISFGSFGVVVVVASDGVRRRPWRGFEEDEEEEDGLRFPKKEPLRLLLRKDGGEELFFSLFSSEEPTIRMWIGNGDLSRLFFFFRGSL